MSRTVVFARRNITELLRSPVSWSFGLAMPIGIFVILQVIMKSIGDAVTPAMFGVERFTGGVVLFGASFLSLFSALLISGDRDKSFLARLFASPMRARDYIAGYILGILPIAVLQATVTFIVALCFGLAPSAYVLPAWLFSVLFSAMFSAIGVILGSTLSAKNAPPLSSVVVQIATLLSGMWFDLDMIGGGFSVFCHVLPFAHGYDLIRFTLAGEFAKVWLPLSVVAGYTVALVVAAVLVFRYKAMKK